jgi:hypothetical protein
MTNIQTFESDQIMKRLIDRVPRYKPPIIGTLAEKQKALEKERLVTEAIQSVFLTRNTTQAERIEVAGRWLNGDFSYYVYFANARDIEPIALIAASLIEIQYELFLPASGATGFRDVPGGKFSGMVAHILQVELQAAVEFGFDREGSFPFQAYPPFSCNPVDNCPKTVDKSVYNSVDKSGCTVDNLTGIFE